MDPDISTMDNTGGYGKFGGLQVVTYSADNTFNGDVVEVAVDDQHGTRLAGRRILALPIPTTIVYLWQPDYII